VIGDEQARTADRGETATIRIVPRATGTVEWGMTFAR
jgi:hypothetical protein